MMIKTVDGLHLNLNSFHRFKVIDIQQKWKVHWGWWVASVLFWFLPVLFFMLMGKKSIYTVKLYNDVDKEANLAVIDELNYKKIVIHFA